MILGADMRKNEILTISSGKPVGLRNWFDYLGYNGIEDEMYSFSYQGCKISIPLKRADCLTIGRYEFEVKDATKESITLKYLGRKKRRRPKSL